MVSEGKIIFNFVTCSTGCVCRSFLPIRLKFPLFQLLGGVLWSGFSCHVCPDAQASLTPPDPQFHGEASRLECLHLCVITAWCVFLEVE